MLKRNIEGESISTPDLSPLLHYKNDNIVKDLKHKIVAVVNAGKRRNNFCHMIKQERFWADTSQSFIYDGVGANSDTILSQGARLYSQGGTLDTGGATLENKKRRIFVE